MKLITDAGTLPLAKDFAFDIKKTSPFFSKEGEQSIPVDLAPSAAVLQALGNPHRLGSNSRVLSNIKAKLASGVFHRDGRLLFSSISKSKISAAIALSESDVYSQYSDTPVSELLKDVVHQVTGVKNLINHIYNVMAGDAEDDFSVFPVLVEKNESSYVVLNEPRADSTDTPQQFNCAARVIYVGSNAEQVPEGYGIAPFLYLHKVLELLLQELGYTLIDNPFAVGDMAKVVLVHNCPDAICAGKLHYSHLVPTCSLSDFIEFLKNKFYAQIVFNAEDASASIVFMEDLLNSNYDIDVSSQVDGEIEIIPFEPSHVVLSSDTSLDAAAPAAETLAALKEKYPIITVLNESQFFDKDTRYAIFQRAATGGYYRTLTRQYSEESKTEYLGSNYFTYDRKNSEESEGFESADVMPVMTAYNGFLAPFVGERVHYTTAADSSTSKPEQKIILCYDAGMANGSTYYTARCRLGTSQKYDNLGVKWTEYDLSAEDCYKKFFASYNKILLNAKVEAKMKVDYTPLQLLSLRLDVLKMCDGSLILPKESSYQVGDKVTCDESSYIVLKSYPSMVEDEPITFFAQTERYVLDDDLDSQLAILQQEYGHITYEWIDSVLDEFVFIPVPSSPDRVEVGERGILFICYPKTQGEPEVFIERVVHYYWIPEAI